MVPKVMIILGSGSDIAIAEKSMDILEKLEIPYSLKIASAHRTLNLVRELVKQGTDAGIEVFIGIAGLAAHLPGVIAAYTPRPVIGVPVDVAISKPVCVPLLLAPNLEVIIPPTGLIRLTPKFA